MSELEPRHVNLDQDVLVLQMPETFGTVRVDPVRWVLRLTIDLWGGFAHLCKGDTTWLAFINDNRPHYMGKSLWLGISKSVPPSVVDATQRVLEDLGADVSREYARPNQSTLYPAFAYHHGTFELFTGDGSSQCLGDEDLEEIEEDWEATLRSILLD